MIEAFRHLASEHPHKKESNDNDSDSLSQIVAQKLESFFEAHEGSLPQNIYDVILEQVERPLFVKCLIITKGKQLKAAEILGLNRNTLRKKLSQLGIDPKSYK